MKIFKTIILILFIIVVAIFTFQNMELVELSFINIHLQIPLSFASILMYVLGALSGGILFSMLKKITRDEKVNKE